PITRLPRPRIPPSPLHPVPPRPLSAIPDILDSVRALLLQVWRRQRHGGFSAWLVGAGRRSLRRREGREEGEVGRGRVGGAVVIGGHGSLFFPLGRLGLGMFRLVLL